jgi:caffeoyl-CoA O-methyltransferase
MLSLIPEPMEEYVAQHSSPEPDLLRALAEETRTKTDAARMLVGPTEGLFLKMLARSLRARRILEIGTFTGYSALMLASGVTDDGEVVTCDVSEEYTAIARRYWSRSPHGKKITLVLGPALSTLEQLEGQFDLIFIDADKENYVAYWDQCLPKLRLGGIVIADNVLWSGRVLDPKEPLDHAIVAFNRRVRDDERVEVVILPVRDGITVATKISD